MHREDVISEIMEAEGEEYTDDPADSGGPTKWGVTQATLSRHRRRQVTPEDVAALSESEAREIYRHMYWTEPKLDMLGNRSMAVAAEVMDTGVNIGTSRAVEMLQRQLNALNNREQLYADIVVDGRVGPMTAQALGQFLDYRGRAGERALVVALNSEQCVYYRQLVERREKDQRFYYGWLTHRVVAHV